jgi:hypothetical protein
MKESIKKVIGWLYSQKETHERELKKCDDAIRAIQSVCDHKGTLVDDGHDSHNSYKKCTVCGRRI